MANQLSRNALIIYLKNLRTLEFIKYQSEKSLQKIEYKEDKLKANLKWLTLPQSSVSKPKRFDMDDFGAYLGFLVLDLIVLGILALFGLFIIGVIIVILLNGFYIHIRKEEYKKQQQLYINDCEKVRIGTQNYYQNVAEYNAKLNELQKGKQSRINNLNTYINQINKQLQKAYSLNIIPQQFRNIYGVTYLYEFLSTSQLSLSDAVLNYQLDRIRSQLDTIISKCDEIIGQMRRLNSNMNEIRMQNNQLLQEARNISHNAELSAQYSQITAMNSSVSLELQKKQLAYQEVDFWLNKV